MKYTIKILYKIKQISKNYINKDINKINIINIFKKSYKKCKKIIETNDYIYLIMEYASRY